MCPVRLLSLMSTQTNCRVKWWICSMALPSWRTLTSVQAPVSFFAKHCSSFPVLYGPSWDGTRCDGTDHSRLLSAPCCPAEWHFKNTFTIIRVFTSWPLENKKKTNTQTQPALDKLSERELDKPLAGLFFCTRVFHRSSVTINTRA